jgi:DNA-directed RNA polymerase subunit RPC12/RpoP
MLRCIECGAESERGLNWEARIAYDPEEDEPAEVAVFCPACAVREFGRFRGP